MVSKPWTKVTAIHKYLKYESEWPFSWFLEEVSKVRLDGDNDTSLKQLCDTHKLKGNSFYSKMIKDLMKQLKMTFTISEELDDETFRLPFFEDLEEIDTTFKIRDHKCHVTITRPYQCSIAVYQLAKLHMLEFYYDFLDQYLDQCDFELIQMDTDLMNMAISDEFNEIVRPELPSQYDHGGKAEFLWTSKYDDRTPGLFKAEFQGTRMIALTRKYYHAEDGESHPKISCNGESKKQT